ncbi:dipeptidase [Georgenia subflava]|uniref:Peptidase M19 n=1 Tax=Georgenia subflava TaxID=1622177 RepID=A0A6N7EET7_9MICO|nr:membrane dipeptidase [Georgenia subflava]MPV35683.1 peptidase M19 [Georgenia subflava]
MSTDRTLIIDGHVDVLAVDGEYTFPLDAAIAGGLAAAVIPVRAGLIPRSAAPGAGAAEHEQSFAAIERVVAGSGGRAAVAPTPDAVVDNAADGVFSIVLGFQNARPLADLAAIERWLDRGVSVFDFGFIGNNRWATSSRPYPYAGVDVDHDGLSPAGAEAVALLNERRVVLDTAQVSPRARQQIVELSTAPVLASHNGLRAKVGEADRTIGDDEVRAIAEKGGVVQIVAFDGYHTPRGDHPRVVADIRELRERFGLRAHVGPSDYYALLDQETAGWDEQTFTDYFREYHAKVRHDWPRTDVERLIDSVDHVAELVGVDHVGLASDFHHGGGVAGWLDHTQTPHVTAALRRRYDETDVAKIWGGNLLRLWREVRADREAPVGAGAQPRRAAGPGRW